MKTWKWAALLAVMALAAAACGDSGSDPTTTTAAQTTTTAAAQTTTTAAQTTTTAAADPIVLGASLPLTGEFSIPGSKHADGYRFCVDELNDRGGILGRPVELLLEDNRSDTEVTVTQTERFINVDNVDALLGTFSSLLGFPASTIAEQNNMVYPVPSSGAMRLYARGYQNLFYFQQLPAELTGSSVVDLVNYYVDQGIIEDAPARAAVVAADDFFAGAIANGFMGGDVSIPGSDETYSLAPGYLAELNMEPVLNEVWPVGYTDWLTLANSISNAEPDFLAAATASPDEAISLAQALQTVGAQIPLVYMSQGAQSEFYDALGDTANGIIIHSVWSPLANFSGTLAGQPYTNQDFIDGFTASFGKAPDEDEAIPFAVCQGIAQAMEGTGGTDNAAMSQWMHARTLDDPVSTIMGAFAWDDRGLPFERSFLVNQWQNGSLEFVYPVGEFPGTSDLLYPKPDW